MISNSFWNEQKDWQLIKTQSSAIQGVGSDQGGISCHNTAGIKIPKDNLNIYWNCYSYLYNEFQKKCCQKITTHKYRTMLTVLLDLLKMWHFNNYINEQNDREIVKKNISEHIRIIFKFFVTRS